MASRQRSPLDSEVHDSDRSHDQGWHRDVGSRATLYSHQPFWRRQPARDRNGIRQFALTSDATLKTSTRLQTDPDSSLLCLCPGHSSARRCRFSYDQYHTDPILESRYFEENSMEQDGLALGQYWLCRRYEERRDKPSLRDVGPYAFEDAGRGHSAGRHRRYFVYYLQAFGPPELYRDAPRMLTRPSNSRDQDRRSDNEEAAMYNEAVARQRAWRREQSRQHGSGHSRHHPGRSHVHHRSHHQSQTRPSSHRTPRRSQATRTSTDQRGHPVRQSRHSHPRPSEFVPSRHHNRQDENIHQALEPAIRALLDVFGLQTHQEDRQRRRRN